MLWVALLMATVLCWGGYEEMGPTGIRVGLFLTALYMLPIVLLYRLGILVGCVAKRFSSSRRA